MAGDRYVYDARADSDDCVRVRVQPSLPCGMSGCGRQATMALAEPDRMQGGLWSLLPICDVCAARLQKPPAYVPEQDGKDQTVQA